MVVGLLDEVNVILGVGGAKQSLEFTDGNAIHAGAVAIDVDIKVRLVAKQVRPRRRGKPLVTFQLVPKRVGGGVDFVRVDPADRVTVTAELAASRPDVDLQDRRRIQRRENPWELVERMAQLHGHLFDRFAILGVLEEEHGEDTGRTGASASGDCEILIDRGVRLKDRIEFFLGGALLLR